MLVPFISPLLMSYVSSIERALFRFGEVVNLRKTILRQRTQTQLKLLTKLNKLHYSPIVGE